MTVLVSSRARTHAFSVLVLGGPSPPVGSERCNCHRTFRLEGSGFPANALSPTFRLHLSGRTRNRQHYNGPAYLKELAYARVGFQRAHIKVDLPDEKMQRLSVHDDTTGEVRSYVTGPTQTAAFCAAGRGPSSGFTAVDLATGAVVWLKDSWTINHSFLRKESDVYRLLMKSGTVHIAPMIVGGDVASQKTQSDEYIKAPWACCTPRRLQPRSSQNCAWCHRQASQNVQIHPGTCHDDARRRRSTLDGILQARHHSWRDQRRKHPSNDGHGILIDWDL
ncbi:hypothetical protein OF83DRAFT_519246 [Amylostereum chailletii]|nr:hypothetical protein OF83DRAFT_519246 [Amylostereum chailletii]